MDQLRFDGRTAIVTGAGGDPGLGRTFALMLAERGANVVVNDVGVLPDHLNYADAASAQAVVDEIRARGGRAVADSHSVATPDGAGALIDAAMQAFGRCDIVVNNAAICKVAPIDVMTVDDYRGHIDANLMGPIWTSKAAWPIMRRCGYGRIVNIASSAFAGVAWMSAYAASKGGLFSLTRSLAAEGMAFGIKVNTVNPTAFTRMVPTQQHADSILYERIEQDFPPELVAPVVACLSHESCPVTGECFEAGGGHVSRTYVARTPGIDAADLDAELLAARWAPIMDEGRSRIVGISEQDPASWNVKPYRPDRGADRS